MQCEAGWEASLYDGAQEDVDVELHLVAHLGCVRLQAGMHRRAGWARGVCRLGCRWVQAGRVAGAGWARGGCMLGAWQVHAGRVAGACWARGGCMLGAWRVRAALLGPTFWQSAERREVISPVRTAEKKSSSCRIRLQKSRLQP